jgi:signal transduction histidine kinase
MFTSVGRRLALLNVAVVTLVIALIGAGTYLLLRESLVREANAALEDRIEAAARAWESRLESGEVTPMGSGESGQDDEDHEEDDESHDILLSGDILLFVFDAEGRLVANDRAVSVEGIPVTAAVERALAGEDDTRTVMVDGEAVRVRTEPIEEHGEIVGVIQATRSERQHDEELRLVGMATLVGIGAGALVALPAGLFLARRAMRPIDAAFQRQRTFVADASHELRTPLTVLRANAEMVQRLPDPSREDVRAEMGEMLREIDRMTAIVNDLLALARYGDTASDLSLGEVEVRHAIESAARALRPQADVAGVTIATEAPERLLATANSALVEQVLRILLDNAVRYTTPGDTVVVSARPRERRVEVCVRDHGPGIDPADQQYVFDRFYRADRARSRHTGGTGLGLPIARSLVQALGGEITLASAPGEGTSVCVTLPPA